MLAGTAHRTEVISGPDSRTVLAWAFCIATLLGCSTVAFVYIGMNAFGRTLSFPRAVVAGLPDWWLWAAATPGIFWFGQRVTLGRGRWSSWRSSHSSRRSTGTWEFLPSRDHGRSHTSDWSSSTSIST